MGWDLVNGDLVMYIFEYKWFVDGLVILLLDEELVDLFVIYVEYIYL